MVETYSRDVFKVRLEVTVEKQTLIDALTDYGWTDGGWVVEQTEPDELGRITVKWNDDGERWDRKPDNEQQIGLWQVGDALAIMATGVYLDHELRRQGLREYHAKAARDILINPTEADADSETIDIAMQMAVLGGVMFG